MLNRLLIYSRRFPPDVYSGSESVIWNLWKRAQEAVEDVRLVAGFRRSRDLLPPDCVALDFSGESIGAPLSLLAKNRLRAARKLSSAIREFAPDAILSNSVEVPYSGRPTVLIVHDFNFNTTGSTDVRGALARQVRLLPYRMQRAFVDRVVAVSQKTKEELLAIGWPETRLSVIQSGVDTTQFSPAPASFTPWMRRLRPSTCVLGYVARMVEPKGQHVAIAALRRLVAAGVDAQLVLVGASNDSSYFERLKREAVGLPVEFVVNPPDVVPYYQSMDVVLFPTLMQEGFGLTAVEGMACGLAVVHSDDAAINEASAGIGLKFRRGDDEDLARKVAWLIDRPHERQARGLAGRDYAVSHYDWSVLFAQYLTVLNEVSEGRSS